MTLEFGKITTWYSLFKMVGLSKKKKKKKKDPWTQTMDNGMVVSRGKLKYT